MQPREFALRITDAEELIAESRRHLRGVKDSSDRVGDATLRVEDHRPVEPSDLAGAQAGFDREQDHRAVAELARDAAGLRPYGLALSDLREFGTPPREIVAQMNETLTERSGNDEERETWRSMRLSMGGVTTLACLPGIELLS